MQKSASTRYWEEILTSRGWSIDRYSTLEHYYIPFDANNIHHQRRIAAYENGFKIVTQELMENMNEEVSMQRLFNLLHNEGIDPNAHDRNGYSLLHRACRLGCTRAVRILLEAGAWPMVTDSEGKTPLHEAAWLGQEDLSIPRLLLDWNSCLLNGVDRLGYTPLDYVRAPYYVHWKQMLTARQDIWWPAITPPSISLTSSTSNTSTTTTTITSTKQNSHTSLLNKPTTPQEWGKVMKKVWNSDTCHHYCGSSPSTPPKSPVNGTSSTSTSNSPNSNQSSTLSLSNPIFLHSSICCGDPLAKAIVEFLQSSWNNDSIGTSHGCSSSLSINTINASTETVSLTKSSIPVKSRRAKSPSSQADITKYHESSSPKKRTKVSHTSPTATSTSNSGSARNRKTSNAINASPRQRNV